MVQYIRDTGHMTLATKKNKRLFSKKTYIPLELSRRLFCSLVYMCAFRRYQAIVVNLICLNCNFQEQT